MDVALPPTRACLQPEDRGGDGRRSFAPRRFGEQALGDEAVSLYGGGGEDVGVVSPQGRSGDADDLGDIVLRDAIGRQRLDLLAVGFGGFMRGIAPAFAETLAEVRLARR